MARGRDRDGSAVARLPSERIELLEGRSDGNSASPGTVRTRVLWWLICIYYHNTMETTDTVDTTDTKYTIDTIGPAGTTTVETTIPSAGHGRGWLSSELMPKRVEDVLAGLGQFHLFRPADIADRDVAVLDQGVDDVGVQ